MVLLSFFVVLLSSHVLLAGEVCRVDLYLVFDGSSSQQEEGVNAQKDLAEKFLACFVIGLAETRIAGAIVQGDQSKVLWNLLEGIDRTAVEQKIDTLSHKNGAGTQLEKVLGEVIDLSNAEPAVSGDRADISNVIVMITDGKTSDQAKANELAKELRDNHGFLTLAIGVNPSGSVPTKDLLVDLTGTEDNIIIEKEVEVLIKRLVKVICTEFPEGSCPLNVAHIIDTSENLAIAAADQVDQINDLKTVHKAVETYLATEQPPILGGVGPGNLQTHVALFDLMEPPFQVIGFNVNPVADFIKKEIDEMMFKRTASSKLSLLLQEILSHYQNLPPPEDDLRRKNLVIINSEGGTYQNVDGDLAQVIQDLKDVDVTVAMYDSSISAGVGGFDELKPLVSKTILGDELAFSGANLANLEPEFKKFLENSVNEACRQREEGLPTTTPMPDNFCEQCWERRTQKPFYMNPENCSTYFHCFRNQSKLEGVLRPCPPGQRFADISMTCVPKWDGQSCTDPCENTTVMMEGWWTRKEECGIFYQCSNYYSVKMCCPPNHRFNKTWGDCMYDATCTSHNKECSEVRVTVPMMTPMIMPNNTCFDVQYGVKRQFDPGYPQVYFVIKEDFPGAPKRIKMPCPQGTLFQLDTCKCTNFTDEKFPQPEMDDCLLNVTFDENPAIDHSKHRFWVDNFGKKKVNIFGGVAFFDGMSHIEIPGLQGNDLGHKLTISFWMFYQCLGDAPSGGLISNRGEKIPGLTNSLSPSILIRTQDNNIIAGVRTTKQNLIDSLTHEISCDKWWHITLVYDRDTLMLYVNCGRVATVNAVMEAPLYWMLFCPLAVGNDQQFGFYAGFMDEVKMCREAFTKEEICQQFDDEKVLFPEQRLDPVADEF